MRGFLYGLARLLGDLNAIGKGKTGTRIARRVTGKVVGRTIAKGKKT